MRLILGSTRYKISTEESLESATELLVLRRQGVVVEHRRTGDDGTGGRDDDAHRETQGRGR